MIISNKCKNRKLKNNILTLGQEARNAKILNNDVINATIGMLTDENGNLYTFEIVKEVISNLNARRMFAYSDTNGGNKFHQAVLNYIFSDKINEFLDFNIRVVATPGGTGALSTAFANYLNVGDKVLLPKDMWENYINIAKIADASFVTYDLYNDNKRFNLNSLKASIDSLNNQQNIVLVINDPCQNPTGFCMNDEEYEELVKLLNTYHRNIVLIMDIAYFDYYSSNGDTIRNRFAKLSKLNENILTIYAFSGSKTFGLYGLRIGAAIAMSRNIEEINCFKDAAEYYARSNWSNCSSLGIGIIEELVLNKKYNQLFKKELNKMSSLLNLRAKTFLEESNKCNLELLPFECGFFVCVPCTDPIKLMNELKNDNCYVVPTKTCIRIAICSISVAEASRLPHIIKKHIK